MAETKKNKVLIWIGIFLAFGIIGVLVYAFRDKIFGKKDEDKQDKPSDPVPPGSTTPNGAPISTWIEEYFPLSKGMYGAKIKGIQKAWGIGADGKFGPKTEDKAKEKLGKSDITEAEYKTIVQATPSTSTTPPASAVGKTAYASSDGVKVFEGTTSTIYKIAKKDEWIGKIKSESGGYYITENNRSVGKNFVYLTNW